MTASEMKEKLIEIAWWVSNGGYQVTWFLRNDGVIIGVNGSGAGRNARDSGVWEITQNGDFCTQWKKLEMEQKAVMIIWLEMKLKHVVLSVEL